MSLHLYRRHRLECEAKRPEESRNGEFEERTKGWKRCSCMIFASGSLGGKFRRKQTGRSAWDEAKAVATAWERSGAWDGHSLLPPVEPTRVSGDSAVSIEQATTAFLAEHQRNSSPNTVLKYTALVTQLQAYSTKLGYIMISQWTPLDVREFRASWGVGPQTSIKRLSTVKAFFEFCLTNEWVTRNVARLVKNPRGKAAGDRRGEQKLPFTDDELDKMFAACATYGSTSLRKWPKKRNGQVVHTDTRYKEYQRTWTGEDLADFISISVYTGLRILDVCTFHIDRLKPSGEVHIRTTKNGTHVYTWVPEWLQERIRERSRTVGPLIFGAHTTTDVNVITDVWRRKLKALWALCGEWKEPPTPHRFRHTFARVLLQRPGVSIRDVAELLGNTEQMVRKHYAAWMPESQERLTAVLREAFAEKPRPNNVVPLPKRD
ncbi:tyrosine-type recombinase/integrase [uncultured Paludibaculum sp.]|uniref:tyrosine-type recombinase/integrase n=1 Tax=uncultured Paludibaculum sp. TaxID=1765020 RepID=UPI002AAB25ED|nr:tyrosine-type recombinase/integrase [uncultured Paludibaculum sp.]